MPRSLCLLLTLAALAAALTACGQASRVADTWQPATTATLSSDMPGEGDPALDGTEWVLESLRGHPVRRSGITLWFDDGMAGGEGGCNRYHLPYSGGEGELHWGDDSSFTAMYCDPPRLMQMETDCSIALSEVARYRKTGRRLELLDVEGGTVLTFVRPKAPLP